MSYTITIIEKKEVVEVGGHEWRKLDDVEVAREAQMYNPRDENEPRTRIKEVMGYTPEFEKRTTKDVKIFEQTIESVDLAAVIKAVNGL